MSWFDALLLGIIQGFTEFFPVSSSGHLVLGQAMLGLEVPGIVFDVAVHVATLFSVVTVYRVRLLELLTGLLKRGEESTLPYVLKLAAATVPAAAVGFGFQDWFEARFDDAMFAATMILVTGCVVWSSRWALGIKRPGARELAPIAIVALVSVWAGTVVPFLAVFALLALLMVIARATAPRETGTGELSRGAAVTMGVAQSLAIFPGISRSGSTVIAGLWRRVDPVQAAEFSFLMSIPAILGAAVLQIPEISGPDLGISGGAILVGFLAAAISGVLAIRFFVALLRRRNFHVFAWYCWAIATLFLVFGS
jgi:undecaprenyl-diphosphatase